MGRKERRDREVKRENYASKHSAEKRKETLIAIGVLAVIAVIVGYAGYLFLNMTETAPGGPENAGIKSSWIHFEGRDGSTIHKHATGVNLGYLFETLAIGLDDQCYVFPDGKQFCSNEDYKLNFFINREQVSDIREYEIMEDDRVLIVYGAETPEELEAYLLQLDNQELVK